MRAHGLALNFHRTLTHTAARGQCARACVLPHGPREPAGLRREACVWVARLGVGCACTPMSRFRLHPRAFPQCGWEVALNHGR